MTNATEIVTQVSGAFDTALPVVLGIIGTLALIGIVRKVLRKVGAAG